MKQVICRARPGGLGMKSCKLFSIKSIIGNAGIAIRSVHRQAALIKLLQRTTHKCLEKNFEHAMHVIIHIVTFLQDILLILNQKALKGYYKNYVLLHEMFSCISQDSIIFCLNGAGLYYKIYFLCISYHSLRDT